MKLVKLFCLSAIVAVSGCASMSEDFVRPSNDKFVLGKTTQSEVIAQMGAPIGKSEMVLNSQQIHGIGYTNHDVSSHLGEVIKTRNVTYMFYNNVLVGISGFSTYNEDSTKFDPTKVSQIVIGKTTKDQVITLLGKPSGQDIYPMISNKDQTAIVYQYVAANFAGVFTTSHSDTAEIIFDKNDIAVKVTVTRDGVTATRDVVTCTLPGTTPCTLK
jgi:outer membrane protein assembly factor BamE (lipoprotein component of BamABCDE complex)